MQEHAEPDQLGVQLMIIIGLILFLIGGAMVETPIMGYLNGEFGIVHIVFGVLFGALFFVPGAIMIFYGAKDGIKKRLEQPIKDVLEALKPGFREAKGTSFLDQKLVNFREHYSEFFRKEHISQNEPIQKDVTQIFRNIMQLQKNRLNRLGLTCELVMKRMAYTSGDNIRFTGYSDGKYSIMDVTEQVAAKTIYKQGSQEIYTKTDKETATYTLIQAKNIGAETVICPNCGVETTREALLDGCDYCGTKFTVEDLGSRIAVFAFRPDEKLRYEKYARTRNKIVTIAIIAAVLAVFLGFTVFAVYNAPSLLAEANGGIILTLLASIFAILVASPVYILSFLIVYSGIILPVLAILGIIGYFVARKYRKMQNRPMLARGLEKSIRKEDPNFSIANFYSCLQNKISSVIYAENADEIQTFARGNLTGLLGKYSDVVGMDVDYMEITSFTRDDKLQYADVDAHLFLTRYNGKRCKVKKETMHVKLLKSAASKTQVVCAPAVQRCCGCGASLDIFRGKRCEYCGRELDLMQYDWVIDEIRIG